MSSADSPKKSTELSAAVEPAEKFPIVERSQVPDVKEYGEYREHLRFDFYHCCAYCTMSEAEAQAIRFAIDHYEPRKLRPDLTKAYANLMYSCDPCNVRKGDRSPPDSARAAGIRFFRADEDRRSDHFDMQDHKLIGKTPSGEYTIDALDLNRSQLKKLREIRRRLTECAPLVAEGVISLRNFSYDQLPAGIRGQAVKAVSKARALEEKLASDIDSILRSYAKSELIDADDDPDLEARQKARKEAMDNLESLFSGKWRAPRS